MSGIIAISKNSVYEASINGLIKYIMTIMLLAILIEAGTRTKSTNTVKDSAMGTDFNAVSLNEIAEESGEKEEQGEVENFVSRLYRVALDREGDEEGLLDWTSRLLRK